MVIKGSSRGQSAANVRRLADHLTNADDNEEVAVVEMIGTSATDLHAALAEMRAVSLGTRTRRALYHTSISVPREKTVLMTPARWRESVDELERRLGLAGHARAVVRHRKHERDHIHVVWNRVNPLTLKCASDAHSYRTHEETARALEERLGLRPVIGAHTRPAGTARPVTRATHRCWQAAERTAAPVEEVSASMQAAWAEAADGQSFAAALKRRGLSLAKGRRGLIVVDAVGTPHSIGRRLGLRAADVRRKLADLREDDFPAAVEAAKRTKGTRAMKGKKTVNGVAPTTPTEPVDWDALLAYWRERGFSPVRKWDAIVVDVAGALVHDYGNRLELTGTAEPTDAQVDALVSACIARDWDGGIRFYGSEAFQRRAKAEAIRQGYPADRITLDCDAASRSRKPTTEPMPEHLSQRLGMHRNTENTGNTENIHHADTSPAPAPRPL